MKYQLVLQFTATTQQDYEDLIRLETLLIDNLPTTTDVDGHDFGLGEFNIFLFTEKAFRQCEKIMKKYDTSRQFKAAYRGFEKEEEYVVLSPPTLKDFKIA